MATSNDPIVLLATLDQRARKHATGLPRQQAAQATWSGIGFRIGNIDLLAPLDHVREVLTYPVISRVPGTKPWVKGIANVRGNLLPVMDLRGYLHMPMTRVGTSSRVVVINHAGVFSGLLVDRVMGLQHYIESERNPDIGDTYGVPVEFIEARYTKPGADRLVFSLHALAGEAGFLQVAA